VVVTGHLSPRSKPNLRIFLTHRHGTTFSLESKTFVPWLRTMTMLSSSVDSCSFNGRRANARSISFVYLLTVVTGHLSSRSTPNIRIFLAHRHGTTCSLESKTFVPWLRTMTMQSEASCYQTQSDCPVFGRTVFYI